MKLCLVSSPGGHLSKMLRLRPWWSNHDRFWVTHVSSGQLDHFKNEQVIAGCFPENRNLKNFLNNLLLALRVVLSERPDLMVSMGAGIAVPFFIVGKLFGCKLIFIETFIFISEPTLSGKILYYLSDEFIVQNRKFLGRYPKAKLCEWKI